MSDSFIGVNAKTGNAQSFVGPDAVALYQAAVLKSAIGLLQKGIKPTRGYTMTKALAAAGRLTGKTYKRTQSDAAIADIEQWILAMKLALPVVVE
jgi:hypothetical protein